MTGMTDRDPAAELPAAADESAPAEAAPSGARSGKRRLAAMVSVRLAPEELVALQQHVQERGLTVSSFLRELALQQIARQAAVPSSVTFHVAAASVGVSSLKTTSEFVRPQVVTHTAVSA